MHTPHKSNERIYIVHNGIIENHLELKSFLVNQGYQLISETDSEVIGHLLDYFLNQGSNILDAIYLTNGVLPVPPIVRLPTTITGMLGLYDFLSFFIYFLLLREVK